jgi:hypothetical protein
MKLPRTSVLVTPWRLPLVRWCGRLFFCKYPHPTLKLCLFSFENLISLPHSLPKNPRKKCALGIDPGSSNSVEASDLPIQIWLNGGSIYFQLARGRGLPPHMQEVELGEAGLLAGAARRARSHTSSLGALRPTIWGGWAIGMFVISAHGWCWDLGRRAEEATMSRATSRDEGERLEMTNHAAMWDWRKK